MKKYFKLVCLLNFLIFLMLSFSLYGIAQQDKLIIKVATLQPPEHSEGQYALKFKELLEEKTDGSVEVQTYFSHQLGTQKDYIEGLRMGTLEVSWVTIGFFSSYEPILNIFELPYLWKSREQALWMVNGPLKPIISKAVEKQGMKLLAFFEVGFRNVTNNIRPIYTPEDLKGIKLRVPQARVSIDALTAMGANAAPLTGTELYLALQQGLFDGQENPFSQIYGQKWYEVQKYCSKTRHQYMMHMVMYSGTLWDKLPTEIREKIEEAAQEAVVHAVKKEVEKDVTAEIDLKEVGMQINEVDVSLFEEAVKPLYQQYIDEFGTDAENIINLIQMSKF